ncbi:hypothetical protein FBU30_007840 [Linnemannia zychae]|nr:hypothetical protein FBU30_007840 [Linnemannia zychae]
MDTVDHLDPRFFLHNHVSDVQTRRSSPSSHSAIATEAAHSSLVINSSSSPSQLQLSMPSNHKVHPDTMDKIKDTVLPQSIVSIDIGIRNLAWVELSKEGEILRWAIDDLLVPSLSTYSFDNHLTRPSSHDQGHPDSVSSTPIPTAASSTKKTKRRASKCSTTAGKVGKQPLPLYDPRNIALRLDHVMRKIFESESVQGIVMERQRFRSGGLPTILDSTFKCGVVEGMIHAWFASWQQHHQQQQQSEWRSSGFADNVKEDEETETVKREPNTKFIESVPPKAVAIRWGIGAIGSKSRSSSSPSILSDRKKKKDSLGVPTDIDAMETKDMNKIGDMTEMSEEAGEERLLLKKSAYASKKLQSKSIVDKWLSPESAATTTTTAISANTAAAPAITTSPPESEGSSTFRVQCSPAIKEWYSQEPKRDDLSDCLLQAVAWFEWKERAIQEAIERSLPQVENEILEKKKKNVKKKD